MFAPGKTTIEDLPENWEVPNIIPEEHRVAFFELINRAHAELHDLFSPIKPPDPADLGIAGLAAGATRCVDSTLSSLHNWFVDFLRTCDPTVDAYTIENTVRQLEGIGAFLAQQAWLRLQLATKTRFRAEDDEVTAHGRGILREMNIHLVLLVQAFRDWAEQNRVETDGKRKTGRPGLKGGGGKTPRGPRKKYKPADDEKLYNDWKSSETTQEEFEKNRDLRRGAVRKARDRMTKRQNRAPE